VGWRGGYIRGTEGGREREEKRWVMRRVGEIKWKSERDKAIDRERVIKNEAIKL
jgi:hypothetical protein